MIDRDYMREDFGGNRGSFQGFLPSLSPCVKWIIIINIAVYLVTFLFVSSINFLGLNTRTPYLFPIQIFTSLFVHSPTDLFHIFFNMLALYFFGTYVEGILGTKRFLRLYFGAGIFGGIIFLVYCLILGKNAVAIGASGAVSGVVLYFCCLAPMATIIFIFIPVKAWVFGAFWIFYALFSMINELRHFTVTHVAHAAHLGGAIFGILFWKYEGLVRGWIERWQYNQERKRRESFLRDKKRMDELLDKVKREGLHTLSEEERAFLQKMSQRLKKGF